MEVVKKKMISILSFYLTSICFLQIIIYRINIIKDGKEK